jgi:hypothetical protein
MDQLDILQEFLDFDCIIYGNAIEDLLKGNMSPSNIIKIYVPKDKVEQLQSSFPDHKKIEISLRESIWVINKLVVMTTTKSPIKTLERPQEILCITNLGISLLPKHNTTSVLKILRRANNKNFFSDSYINTSLRWIKYLLEENHEVYGSWPSWYIAAETTEQLHRDIDVCTSNYNSIRNMMTLLVDLGLCEFNNTNSNTYIDIPLNIKMELDDGDLIFDIHRKSKNMASDAFYNNLKLTKNGVTVNYQPSNLNFITTLILTFNDLFSNNYTLIEQLPERIDNLAQLRLMLKPIIFSLNEARIINYEYLENIYGQIEKLSDKIIDGKCYKNCSHQPNIALGVPSNLVVKIGKKHKCVQCAYNHVLIQKEIKEKNEMHNKLKHFEKPIIGSPSDSEDNNKNEQDDSSVDEQECDEHPICA